MILPLFISFLIKSGLLFTGGLITTRAISNLLYPPLQLTPVVQIEDGDIQGKIGYSRNGSEYWQFLGIPYGHPPRNSLRFQPPIPAKRWYNLKQVISYPPACMQYDPVVLMRVYGEEDCLYINVFMNPVKTTTKKPVLVFIHGEGFYGGDSNSYHADYFMDHPIILITFNYRLGPLGFLNFQKKDPMQRFPRGNMGLKDQNLALQWVQRNARFFGGDPGKVTVMGQSAGAISLHLHMLSSMSAGLFHRAIAFSGNAATPWAFSANPGNVAVNYATRKLGCSADNWTMVYECYMRMDARKLVQHQSAWADPLREKDLFVPSVEVEPYHRTEDRFLTESPKKSFLSYGEKAGSRIPFMMGVTSGEGGMRSARFHASPEKITELDKNWDKLIGKVLLLDASSMKPLLAQNLRRLYFDSNSSFAEDFNGFMKNVTKLCSDVMFYEPMHKVATEHSKFAPTYMLYFDYKSVMLPGSYSFYGSVRPQDIWLSDVKLLQGLYRDWRAEHLLGQSGVRKFGVGHGEELFQLWNINGLSKLFSDGDLKFSQSFVKAIVDFASHTKHLAFRETSWPPVSAGVLRNSPEVLLPYLLINRVGKGKLTEEPVYSSRMRELIQLLL